MNDLASLRNDLKFLRTKEFTYEKGIELNAQTVDSL